MKRRRTMCDTLLAASSSSSSLDDRAWRILGPRSCTTALRPSYSTTQVHQQTLHNMQEHTHTHAHTLTHRDRTLQIFTARRHCNAVRFLSVSPVLSSSNCLWRVIVSPFLFFSHQRSEVLRGFLHWEVSLLVHIKRSPFRLQYKEKTVAIEHQKSTWWPWVTFSVLLSDGNLSGSDMSSVKMRKYVRY